MTPLCTRICPYPHPRAPPPDPRLKPGPMFVAFGGVMTRKPNTQSIVQLMCLSDQPALKVRLAASSKRDGDECTWVVNVAPTAAAVWAERTCEVAGGAAQDALSRFISRLFTVEGGKRAPRKDLTAQGRVLVGGKKSPINIEALCAAPPEALAHSPSQMPPSCPVAPPSQREMHKDGGGGGGGVARRARAARAPKPKSCATSSGTPSAAPSATAPRPWRARPSRVA